MKRIVLFVASILTALQSFANRNYTDANCGSLVLLPSDGIYSHSSHAAHYSHYSRVESETDSIRGISIAQKEKLRKTLMADKIIHVYKSAGGTLFFDGKKLCKIEKRTPCVYLEYERDMGQQIKERHIYMIPFMNKTNEAYYVKPGSYAAEKVVLSGWMKELLKILK